MTIALDLARRFADLADMVKQRHRSLLAARPADGSPDLPAWDDERIRLSRQFSVLNAASMMLANEDAGQVLDGLGPRLEAVAAATERAQDRIADIARVNDRLALVAAMVGVAAAIPAVVANPLAGGSALFTAGHALAAALNRLDDADEPQEGREQTGPSDAD